MASMGMVKLSGILAAFNSGRVVSIGLGLLLTTIGAAYEWIRFPISTAIRGYSLGFVPLPLSMPGRATLFSLGAIFFGAMLLAVVAELARWTRIRKALAGLAILVLFYHLLSLAFVDGRWIEQYVAEGEAFSSQLSFLNSHFVLNDGEDNTYTYLSAFEYVLPDRLVFLWESFGHGLILAFAGAGLVAVAPGRREDGAGPALWPVAIVIFITLFAIFSARPLRGEYFHLLGDRKLAQGANAAALDLFADALSDDPILARSRPLMVKISKAHYALKGRGDPYALLYLANFALASGTYDEGISMLPLIPLVHLENLPYREAYLRAVAMTGRSLYAARGLSIYGEGNTSGAERDFLAALDVSVPSYPVPLDLTYMAALVEMDLRQSALCARRAQRLIQSGTVGRKSARADLNNTEGDCDAQMFEYSRAREAYFRSYELDNRTNFRAYQGMSGS